MTYLISMPETQQAVALIDFIKLSGIATKIKAIKTDTELEGIDDGFDVPNRTDEELKYMISENQKHNFEKILRKNTNPNVKMF